MTSFRPYLIRCPHCGVPQLHELVDGNQAVTCRLGYRDEDGRGRPGCGKSFRVSVLNGSARHA
jgi:hypothetical protein